MVHVSMPAVGSITRVAATIWCATIRRLIVGHHWSPRQTSTGFRRRYVSMARSTTWAAAMPAALAGMATALWNGTIYVAGGDLGFGTLVNTLYAYDVSTNSWSMLASIPQ